MRQPLAWIGAAVVAGVLTWPWLRPDPGSCIGGALALALLALVFNGALAARAAVVVAAGLLGVAAPGELTPPTWNERTHGLVQVTRLSSVRATLEGRAGVATTWWSEVDTRVGDRFAVRLSPSRPRPVLPGATSDRPADLLGGRTPVRVRRSLRLGGPAPPADPRFQDLEHGGILRALIHGDRRGVDQDTRTLLRWTGTSHLLAISGLHIGLVATLAAGLGWVLSRPLALTRWWWLPRLIPGLCATGAALSYAHHVGSSASASRAAVMVAAAAVGSFLGRGVSAWSLLGLAAAVIGLWRPALVMELGFQLSFSAVAGILLVGPRVTRLLPPDRPRAMRWLVGSLAATVGATAGTLPLVALHFQALAPLSPLTNLFAGPLVGLLIVPSALLGAGLGPPLGPGLLALADHATGALLFGLQLLAEPPWTPAVGAVGALGLAGAVLLRRQPLLALAVAVVALGLRSHPRQRLTATFLAVGQGDATLVELPDGRRLLVDGGPPSQRVLDYLRRRGIRRLDALVLTHDHPDHSGGLVPVAENLRFDALWLPTPPADPTGDAARLTALARDAGVQVLMPDQLPPDPLLRVEHPLDGWRAQGRDHVNEESLVLRARLGAHSLLLTGDVEEDAEAHLHPRLQPATVVKVAHHGSRSSSAPELVRALRPALAVVSVGRSSPYGHPHPLTLAAWLMPAGPGPACTGDDAHGRPLCTPRLMRTDLEGTVEWSTDGHTWTLRTWRVDRGWRLRFTDDALGSGGSDAPLDGDPT